MFTLYPAALPYADMDVPALQDESSFISEPSWREEVKAGMRSRTALFSSFR